MTVDAETFTTKSLESETSSSSSDSSSGSLPESDTELPYRLPQATAKSLKPTREQSTDDKQPLATEDKFQAEKTIAPGKIHFQTIPEEIEDESDVEGIKRFKF